MILLYPNEDLATDALPFSWCIRILSIQNEKMYINLSVSYHCFYFTLVSLRSFFYYLNCMAGKELGHSVYQMNVHFIVHLF